MPEESMLSYYKKDEFNPVPIKVENQDVWKAHFAKRLNLYQRHLRIPLSLLRNRPVLEFACNSGENSLVLASFGANLTLVEPNEQVLPRLNFLFKKFGFENNVLSIEQIDLEGFKSEKKYDLVLAEGFLFTLSNRNEMLKKVCSFLTKGGLAVTSFEDKYGSLIELTKRMILKRACELEKVDFLSKESLKLAEQLFLEDFKKINKSRPFEVWWKDSLVTPFFGFRYLWSYPEILQLLEKEGCEFYSSSPKWASVNHFTWYKNALNKDASYSKVIDNWKEVFHYFLTGLPPSNETEPATSELIDSVSELILQVSTYTTGFGSINSVAYPLMLDEYLKKSKNGKINEFNSEIKSVYEAAKSSNLNDLISAYHKTKILRDLWGTPYHYICFNKRIENA